ncbi:collagen alpha-1(I) chain-like isoform X2 [Trachypithecus francoisi]|uniref:collagen alpha-1(I) chain-like isoform X2 n=1 Tax=Trachypithecus francoisi TaxID=54180 RepID=UPI00141A9F13|nr:collagen alpha-1(I) chain-like isoform X2 [Trachypithecus francoisi]
MAPPAAPAPPLSAPAPGSARPWAPGSECGRAPCSGHGLGAPGGAGGGRGPSALMPGPAGERWVRGPAPRRLLRGRRGCCSGPRASSGAFSLPVGPPAGLGSAGAPGSRRSLSSPLPVSPPPRPAALWSLRAPLAPAPAPGAHVTSANEHAPRGRSPRPPRAHTRARTRAPALPPHASARAPDPGGRGQRSEAAGRNSCCFRLPGRRRGARRERGSALGEPGVSARVPGLPSRVPAGKLFSSSRKPRWSTCPAPACPELRKLVVPLSGSSPTGAPAADQVGERQGPPPPSFPPAPTSASVGLPLRPRFFLGARSIA